MCIQLRRTVLRGVQWEQIEANSPFFLSVAELFYVQGERKKEKLCFYVLHMRKNIRQNTEGASDTRLIRKIVWRILQNKKAFPSRAGAAVSMVLYHIVRHSATGNFSMEAAVIRFSFIRSSQKGHGRHKAEKNVSASKKRSSEKKRGCVFCFFVV